LDACLERYGLRKGKLYCGGCSFPEARRLITPETREIPANGALWSRLWGKLEFRSITVIAFNKLLDYWLAQPHNVAAEPEQQFRGRWPNDPEIFGVYGEEGLRRAGEHMKMLLALLQRHSVKLTIAVYPWPYQIAERDLDSLQVEFWRTWTAANQVDFIDCFPSFINQTAPQKILEQYYFKGDVHWNSKGHRVVADALSAHYQSRMRQHHIQ
ncbi:MAG TPA: hypothetical protein PLP17_16665, partial [Oligoflexia bacterium]|nr:hypothetical protein [Oligoflexia bacterium]